MKLKITYILVLVALFTVATYSAHAQVQAGLETRIKLDGNEEGRKEIRTEKKADLKNLRASTSVMMKDLKGEYKDMRKDMMSSTTMNKREVHASTTEMFRLMKDQKRELQKNMKREAFEIRKDALVNILNKSLVNLTDSRERINKRILKLEGEGRTMTDAKAALAVADDKLAKARIAVDALAAVNVSVTSTGAAVSATANIELTKHRVVGDTAIKAVKEARDALKVVLQLITPAANVNATGTTTISN